MTEKLFGTAPMMNTSELEDPKCSVLYFGRAKTGKTHSALTWPKPLVIYWDQNQATLRKFPDIQFVAPASFKQFKNEILPAIRSREVDAETIVFDSYSFAANQLKREIQGPRDKPRVQDWGTIFDNLIEVTNELALTTAHKSLSGSQPDRRYHFVATVHDRDSYDDDGNLVKVDPAIQGQFKDWLPRYFNTVLVTACEIEKERVQAEGQPPSITNKKVFFAYSCPPNTAWPAGDGFGGGKYKELPAKLDGTYPGLAKAWGLP